MLKAVWATTAAAPLLHLGLQKIARTPRARLTVGYRLLPKNHPHGVVGPDRDQRSRVYSAPRALARPLGAEWNLERLLAGGIVGEPLPLANLRIEQQRRAPPAIGTLVDLRA